MYTDEESLGVVIAIEMAMPSLPLAKVAVVPGVASTRSNLVEELRKSRLRKEKRTLVGVRISLSH